MAASMDPLTKICAGGEAWRVKVRIVRMWSVPGFINPSYPISVEMVLMDEHGGKIQESIRKTLVCKFLPLLAERGVHDELYFTVAPNIGSYRATTHEYRLVFMCITIVAACDFEVIPLYGLSLVPFNDIDKHDSDSDFLVDVIGLLTGVSSERQYPRDGKVTKLVIIELTNYQGRLECADYVDELNAFVASGNLDQPIVVLQLAKVNMFRGNIILQNLTQASRILFNLDIFWHFMVWLGLNQLYLNLTVLECHLRTI